jgi:hypothetical protein
LLRDRELLRAVLEEPCDVRLPEIQLDRVFHPRNEFRG